MLATCRPSGLSTLHGRLSVISSIPAHHRSGPDAFTYSPMSGDGYGMSGDGLMDAIRSIVRKGKTAVDEGIAGAINLIPSSDKNARPMFPGERHAVLKLANGKYGVANYMGPGTQLEKRLIRQDPPRSIEDKVALAHDSRYALAKSQADVVKADAKMVNKLQELKRTGQGNKFNIELGLRPIQAKMLAERTGIAKPGQIASFGGTTNPSLVQRKLDELEQEGFGILPGEVLKQKLLEMSSGQGLSLPGGRMNGRGMSQVSNMLGTNKLLKSLTTFVSSKILPHLLKQLGLSGSGLRLAGQGKKATRSLLFMRMKKALDDGARRDGSTIVGTGVMDTLKGIAKKIPGLALGAAKTLLPILIQVGLKKYGQRGKGIGSSIMKALNSKLVSGMAKAFKWFINSKLKPGQTPLFGSGMIGEMEGMGFWDDFKKGFMKVWDPIIKVGKTVAPLIPMVL